MEPTITSIQPPLLCDGLLVDFSRNICCVVYSLLILALVKERKLTEIIVSRLLHTSIKTRNSLYGKAKAATLSTRYAIVYMLQNKC